MGPKITSFGCNIKAKPKFKNSISETCIAKAADSNSQNQIALPSKMTKIYPLGKN